MAGGEGGTAELLRLEGHFARFPAAPLSLAGAGAGEPTGCCTTGGRLAGGTGRSGAAGPVITSKSSDIADLLGWRPLHFWRHSDDEGQETRKPPAGGAALGCCANAWT